MNTNSNPTPNPKDELSLPKGNNFWFDHETKPLTLPSFTFTNQSTIFKQKSPPSLFTPRKTHIPSINRKTSPNKKNFCDILSGHQIHNTNVLSLLSPSKERKASKDALSSWRNDNTTQYHTKPSIPSLHSLFLNKPNEGQALSKRFANTIRITQCSNRKPKPEKTYPKQRFDNELQAKDSKRGDGTDELDDFISQYVQKEDNEKRNNQKLCKLVNRKNKPEELVKRTKQIPKKVISYNRQSYDLSKENLVLKEEYKLGNSSKHFDVPVLDLKKIRQGMAFSSEQHADKEKKNRLRKTGELIGMDSLL